jgi:glycosyltransferase involved in cell wall biosynthesis
MTESQMLPSAPAPESVANVELSIVMPCLNEAETLATCIRKARMACEAHGIPHEVIVADNGSVDGSREIAEREGARVVPVHQKGYGMALMGGIAAARGEFVIMGDADDSYDFLEVPKFVDRLRAGADLVQGCRLERGGGTVLPGAMPALHRRLGNPMFSAIARRWFGAPINDVYCGMRGFRKSFQQTLGQRCGGMEFATEMIVKSTLSRAEIDEVPITLHRDGRTAHAPHLRTVRDGWRTLRFFLVYSPRWLFFLPGLVLMLVGMTAYGLALPGVQAFGVIFDAHTLLFGSLALICGYQSVLFAVMTKVFASAEGLLPRDERLERMRSRLPLDRVLAVGTLVVLAGLVLLGLAVNEWRVVHFGELDYADTMRLVVPGVTVVVMGFLTMLAAFFISVLMMRRV